jgi:hypothetical protein
MQISKSPVIKKMKKIIALPACVILALCTHAQKLPPFVKWSNNNSPDCKNVFLTKDSMVLVVKNKCNSEGTMTNWRPSVGVDEGLNFSVPAGAKVQLTITYKFQPAGNDVFGFYGTYDPESDNSDIAFSRSFQLPESTNGNLPAAATYTKAVLLINFNNENDKPVWKAPISLKGSMNFHFNLTTTTGDETHIGSSVVIKEAKLEVIN